MALRSERGFTLLELVVVIFIAGLAVAIASVSVNRAQQKSVLKQQAARLHSTLRHARDVAILERAPVSFVLDPETGSFWLERLGKIRGLTRDLPEGLNLGGDVIVFMPKGNSTGGRVALWRDDGQGYVVMVNKVTGIARLSRL